MLVDIYPEPFTPPSAVYRWPFIFDILPTDMLSARGFNWLPRCKVDGVEKLITQAVIDENENSVGQELTIDLADPADRTAFTSDASIDFGIGKKISGAWDESTFLTLLENASTLRTNYTIAGQGAHTANDKAPIVISSAENDRLNKTSESGLILYDPTRVSISDTDANPVQGFTTELMDIAGMKLEDVLQELLVERCGFDSYVAHLHQDDYPIQKVDVPMGTRFWDALAPHIAMFYPAVRIIDNVIHLSDTTIEQPSGFPAPYEVTLSVVKDQLNLSQEKQKLDGLFLTCTGLFNNYDTTDFEFFYPIEVNDLSVTNIARCFVRFWKKLGSGKLTLVRSELNFEDTRTFRDEVETERTSTIHEFDHQIAQVRFIRSRGETLMPDLPDGGTSTLRQSFEDREQIDHQIHPFKRDTIFVARREKRSTGLINVDTDNPNVLGEPARLQSDIADRSSWSAVGQAYEYGRTQTRVETAEPLRDGTVRILTKITDEVHGRLAVLEPQIRAGEIGVGLTSTSQQTIAVFLEDDPDLRTTQRMDSLDIRELPLKYGHPLARRILRNRQTANQNVTLPIIGYDPYLQKGALIAPKDRDGVSLGNFIITGRRIVITREGLTMELTARQVATQASVTVQSAPQSYPYGIVESTNQVFPLQIECDNTTYISIDPAAVSDLTIEAKESTQGAYTDLEAGVLDLSSFTGTRTIQVRATAGSIAGTQPVRRVLDLITNAQTRTLEVITENGETVTDNGDPVYQYA